MFFAFDCQRFNCAHDSDNNQLLLGKKVTGETTEYAGCAPELEI